MNITRIGGLAAVTLCSAALLAGCGSSSSSADTASADTTAAAATTTATTTAATTTAATTTGEKVGGMATCDQASISKAVEATGTAKEPNTLATPTSFECSDGWAYAYVNSGTGDAQYTGTTVFEAEGQFWIPKDRQKVCISPGNQVPKAIYQPACETN
ncbi:MAG: hypothetical protein ACOYL4_01365 [Miltoncostaeaceae bacterium]